MLKISCPHCGVRSETEFSYGGEADIYRPEDPYALSDEAWARYVFYKKNTRGNTEERWYHTHGCRKWFTVVRDTVNNEITS